MTTLSISAFGVGDLFPTRYWDYKHHSSSHGSSPLVCWSFCQSKLITLALASDVRLKISRFGYCLLLWSSYRLQFTGVFAHDLRFLAEAHCCDPSITLRYPYTNKNIRNIIPRNKLDMSIFLLRFIYNMVHKGILYFTKIVEILGFPCGLVVKNLPAMQETLEMWV